jgi:hypothetical protein
MSATALMFSPACSPLSPANSMVSPAFEARLVHAPIPLPSAMDALRITKAHGEYGARTIEKLCVFLHDRLLAENRAKSAYWSCVQHSREILEFELRSATLIGFTELVYAAEPSRLTTLLDDELRLFMLRYFSATNDFQLAEMHQVGLLSPDNVIGMMTAAYDVVDAALPFKLGQSCLVACLGFAKIPSVGNVRAIDQVSSVVCRLLTVAAARPRFYLPREDELDMHVPAITDKSPLNTWLTNTGNIAFRLIVDDVCAGHVGVLVTAVLGSGNAGGIDFDREHSFDRRKCAEAVLSMLIGKIAIDVPIYSRIRWLFALGSNISDPLLRRREERDLLIPTRLNSLGDATIDLLLAEE